MGCTCSGCVKWGALVVALVVLFVSGVQLWLREKSYVFCARELADITTDVLRTTKGDPNCVRILESVALKNYKLIPKIRNLPCSH